MFHRLSLPWMIVAAFASVVRETKPDPRQTPNPASGDRVIAIDVLLEPDAKMAAKARAANAKLRTNYPRGYTLGREQVAHISLLHGYVHEKDLPAIEVAVSKAIAAAKPLNWQLAATGYEYSNWAGVAITSIGVAPTPELSRLQDEIVKAVEPFVVAAGTVAAFSTNKELPRIENEIVNYVEKFVTNSSGKKYNPHITIGVAHEDFVEQLKAEPFQNFSFNPAGVAIYQLGSFGTAQKRLWEWKSRASGDDNR